MGNVAIIPLLTFLEAEINCCIRNAALGFACSTYYLGPPLIGPSNRWNRKKKGEIVTTSPYIRRPDGNVRTGYDVYPHRHTLHHPCVGPGV